MKRDDIVYVQHVLNAIAKINEYVAGVSEQEFFEATMRQDAVIRQLEIIGEAVKNISVLTKQKADDIPWKDMAGMRDVLIHQYFGVDISAVWQTTQDDLDEVEQLLRVLVKS